jgi:hypothetical protein
MTTPFGQKIRILATSALGDNRLGHPRRVNREHHRS